MSSVTLEKFIPPVFVSKGWGWESWIVNNDQYCGKVLFFKKGKRCSWHKHLVKSETFFLNTGKLLLTYGWEDDISLANHVELNPGECFEIPVGLRHQMYGLEDSHLIEFSTTHSDEDSIRITKGD